MAKWFVGEMTSTGASGEPIEVEAANAVAAAKKALKLNLKESNDGGRLKAKAWQLPVPGKPPEITYLYEPARHDHHQRCRGNSFRMRGAVNPIPFYFPAE